MAYPKVFVSSTCYDLSEVRDSLESFIKSYHFIPTLSEYGDIFYHPDLHTQESCIREIQNCQLFILIIGGRFGGNYVSDKTRSIVNAEFIAAKKNNLPIFCFIKKEVYADHRLYINNKKDEELIEKINFPSIENQKNASNIFKFIDEVRKSTINNGIFTFEFAREIQETLGKQWAGMFCDFLSKRMQQKQYEITANLLSQLTLVSNKTEEIIKKVYIHLEPQKGEDILNSIDEEIEGKLFFESVLKKFEIRDKIEINSFDELVKSDEKNWVNFLLLTGDFYVEGCMIDSKENGFSDDEVIFSLSGSNGQAFKDNITEKFYKLYYEFSELYSKFQNLPSEQRKKILKQYTRDRILASMT